MTLTTAQKWCFGLAATAAVVGTIIVVRRRKHRQLGLITQPQSKLAKSYLSDAKRTLGQLEKQTEATEASLQALRSLAAKTQAALAAKHEAVSGNNAWNVEPIYDEHDDVTDDHEDADDYRAQLEEVTAPDADDVDGALQHFEDDWKHRLKSFAEAIENAEADY